MRGLRRWALGLGLVVAGVSSGAIGITELGGPVGDPPNSSEDGHGARMRVGGGTGHGVHTGTTAVAQAASPVAGFLDRAVFSNHAGR